MKFESTIMEKAEQVSTYCTGLELAAMSPEKLVEIAKSLHADQLEFERMSCRAERALCAAENGNRTCAWTIGRLLTELKSKKVGEFREYAKSETGLSNPTITRYMKLSKFYGNLAVLLETTKSLRDAYLKAGLIKKKSDTGAGNQSDPASPVAGPAEELLRYATMLQKKFRVVRERGVVLKPAELIQLELVVEELKAFLEQVGATNPNSSKS